MEFTLEENRRMFDICNITQWHEAGYKGQGIKIAIFDRNFKDSEEARKLFNNKVRFIDGYGKTSDKSSHGSMTAYIIHQILPEAEIYVMRPRVDNIYWCIENGMDIISVSMTLFQREGFKEASEKAIENDILLLSSSGNNSEEWNIGRPARKKTWIGVGAVHLRNSGSSRERIYRARYSSYTKDEKEIWEMVEIMGFAGVYILSPTNQTRPFSYYGTSCACPWVASMSGLLKQIKKFTKKNFRDLDFIQENVIEIDEEGYSRKTGHGLFRLPDVYELEKKLREQRRLDIVSEHPDIKGHWAEESLVKAIDKDVIRGYKDGTVKPDEAITRAEVVAILARLGLLD